MAISGHIGDTQHLEADDLAIVHEASGELVEIGFTGIRYTLVSFGYEQSGFITAVRVLLTSGELLLLSSEIGLILFIVSGIGYGLHGEISGYCSQIFNAEIDTDAISAVC